MLGLKLSEIEGDKLSLIEGLNEGESDGEIL